MTLPHPAAVKCGWAALSFWHQRFRSCTSYPESSPSSSATMEKAIEQEVFALEMGYGLLILADKGKGETYLSELRGLVPILPRKWECFYLRLVSGIT